MPHPDIDPDRLRQITSDMVDALTSDAFVEAMRAVRSAPADQRVAEASRRLTPAALREQGVALPEDLRISSRYFEEGYSPIELGSPDGKPNLVNVLNEYSPGLPDRLRLERPDIFDLLNPPRPFGPKGPGPDPGPVDMVGIWGCACGGAASVCGGAGGGS